MNDNQQISDAMAFLRQIKEETSVACVIAGGFVRDNFLGRPYRDIDLYVPYDGHGFSKVYESLTGGDDDAHASTDETSDEYVHQSIQYQIEVAPNADWQGRYPAILDGHPVNIIGLNSGTPCTGDEVVGRYNLGICQAWISGDTTGVGEFFRKDADEERITLLRSDWGHEATLRQWIKLQAKYPWPLRMNDNDNALSIAA